MPDGPLHPANVFVTFDSTANSYDRRRLDSVLEAAARVQARREAMEAAQRRLDGVRSIIHTTRARVPRTLPINSVPTGALAVSMNRSDRTVRATERRHYLWLGNAGQPGDSYDRHDLLVLDNGSEEESRLLDPIWREVFHIVGKCYSRLPRSNWTTDASNRLHKGVLTDSYLTELRTALSSWQTLRPSRDVCLLIVALAIAIFRESKLFGNSTSMAASDAALIAQVSERVRGLTDHVQRHPNWLLARTRERPVAVVHDSVAVETLTTYSYPNIHTHTAYRAWLTGLLNEWNAERGLPQHTVEEINSLIAAPVTVDPARVVLPWEEL